MTRLLSSNAVQSLNLPREIRDCLPSVSLELAASDGMHTGDDVHYLSCGASAAIVVQAAARLGKLETPSRILDFGGGAGRVTRWLKAIFPGSSIEACDISESDLTFQQGHLGVATFLSSTDIDALTPSSSYDLIWVGSVITHLRRGSSRKLIAKLFSWLNPGGILVVSFHGRRAREIMDTGKIHYISRSSWQHITIQCDRSGFGYADYVDQKDYGISLTTLPWIIKRISKLPPSRLILMGEALWDSHQDVFAIQRI